MAEGILRSMLPSDRDDVEVRSAGTAGIDGMPATKEAIEVAAAHGVDISGHASTALTRELLGRSDLVLALAAHHLGSVTDIDPGVRTRSYLLSEFADGSQEDVPDPIGASVAEYEKVYDMIERYLRDSLGRVVMLADRKAGGTKSTRDGLPRERSGR